LLLKVSNGQGYLGMKSTRDLIAAMRVGSEEDSVGVVDDVEVLDNVEVHRGLASLSSNGVMVAAVWFGHSKVIVEGKLGGC